ncbi:hypothetical protein BDF19DRAFT_218851 [Syncephalis fuscata]|nr:hypothetical protein BDF19DRAFT_218851 [Syncephalis fuscata]
MLLSFLPTPPVGLERKKEAAYAIVSCATAAAAVLLASTIVVRQMLLTGSFVSNLKLFLRMHVAICHYFHWVLMTIFFFLFRLLKYRPLLVHMPFPVLLSFFCGSANFSLFNLHPFLVFIVVASNCIRGYCTVSLQPTTVHLLPSY